MDVYALVDDRPEENEGVTVDVFATYHGALVAVVDKIRTIVTEFDDDTFDGAECVAMLERLPLDPAIDDCMDALHREWIAEWAGTIGVHLTIEKLEVRP